jgi:hypothetical protein
MPRLKLADAAGSASNINATQAEFRAQIAALNDVVRQLAGNASVSSGSVEIVDPLTAPFTLYVNPYIGSDTFASGSYNTYEEDAGATDDEKIAAKLKRLDTQRLTCGYTAARPFKTINRAVIEAALITSKNWFTFTDPRAHLDCVSIVLGPGVHTVYNDPGSGTPVVWTDGYEPTPADLIKFNPATTGGVLLPRGCSLCGPDLRKVTFRPSFVPTNADEIANRSNRREIFKVTGTGYFFGFTFMDKIGATSSHHLLSAFGFASKAELDTFYSKVYAAVGTGGNLSEALTVTRGTEYRIVAPIEGTPSEAWDVTSSASPYIFNCSVRSDYGMGGIHADGAKVEGLRSMVTANFTGVSLQRDMACWELYDGANWVTMPDYATYIATSPNDARMKPTRRSHHIRAINDAFIQEVSVFAIGQGAHHATESGGEITITNSNSSFGGVVGLSTGYKSQAFTIDSDWRIAYFRVPVNIGEKRNNIKKIYLGTIGEGGYIDLDDRLFLSTDLNPFEDSTTIPELIGVDGYSLREDSYIWVENPLGGDWRAPLAASAWSTSDANRINFKTQLADTNGASPGSSVITGINFAVGKRVYIRRLVDTRTEDERQLHVGLFATSALTRQAQRDYILQLDPTAPALPGDVDPYVTGVMSATAPISVSSVRSATISQTDYPQFVEVFRGMEVQLRRNAPSINYANSTFYRDGTTVKYANKHFTALRDVTTAASGGPPESDWQESYVHMPSTYNPEDYQANQTFTLTLDNDTSSDPSSITLGYNFDTVWTAASTGMTKVLQDQYRSSIDYQAAQTLLTTLGFTTTVARTALQPRATADRIRRTNNTSHFPTAPSSGLATERNAWAAEFRRPSVLRLFGHAWEWAGTLNYSKAFPAAQKEMTALNKFTYYFSNETGGRVYGTGFNEEGYIVKPTGIEDISTGQSRGLTSLATVEDSPVNEFPTGINAGGKSVLNDVTLVGDTIFGNAAKALQGLSPSQALGPVQLAGLVDLEGSSLPESDSDINDNNQPKAITNLGLNYWREFNSLLSERLLSFDTGTDPNEYPVCGMLGRLAFIDEWCGYAEGGGAVTQATDKSTAVTLNNPCGQITVNNASLAATTAVTFQLNNSRIAPSDVLVVAVAGGTAPGNYSVTAICGQSTAQLTLRNLTGGSLAEAVVISFVLIKATTL